MKRKFIIVALVGLGILALIPLAWSEIFPSGTWRYRITVNVETPEGLKTGSAVREVTNRDNTILGVKFPEAGARISKVKGEAVVIDLGKRGVIFSLIDQDSYEELYSAFFLKGLSNTYEFQNLKSGMKEELKVNHPKMVTFKDFKNPRNIQIVYEQRMGPRIGQVQTIDNNFKKLFGDGVELKSIVVEVTDEPVTWGTVEKYLPQVRPISGFERFKKEY